MNQPIVSVNHLQYSTAKESLFECLTFDIFAGEYVGLIGQNGTGKSTLLNLILGIKKPTSGSSKIFNTESSKFHHWEKIGYVPQRQIIGQIPITVSEFIRTGDIYTGLPFEDKLKKTLEILNIEHLLTKLTTQLSGGEWQKILIARGILNQPELLILDEPTIGIDAKSRNEILEHIRSNHKNTKQTIIHVTHNIEHLTGHTDRILCMDSSNMGLKGKTIEHVHHGHKCI